MGLRLFFLPNCPGAAFIQGATFIPDSRVIQNWLLKCDEQNIGKKNQTSTLSYFQIAETNQI